MKRIQNLYLNYILIIFSIFIQFFHANSQNLSVVYPSGGEIIVSGMALVITWSSSTITENINLYYWDANSTTMSAIAKNISASSGSYSWLTSPILASDKLRIMIQDSADPKIYGMSGGFFTVGPAEEGFPVIVLENNNFIDQIVNVFPNPSKREFSIELNPKLNLSQSIIRITDIRGTVILELFQVKETNIINLSNRTAGIYIINILTEDKAIVKKVLLE